MAQAKAMPEDKKVRELKAEKAESSRLKVNTTDNNPQHATNNAQQTQRNCQIFSKSVFIFVDPCPNFYF